MVDILIRPTQPGDTDILFDNLRAADLAECKAYGDRDIRESIRASAARSLLCWTAFADGEMGAIMGCAPISLMSGIGSPWMLGTPVLDQHSRVLVRMTPEYIARMLRVFPHLVNFVHSDNVTSVRWLRRLGFTLHDAVPYGARGELFRPFEMRSANV